MSATETTNAAGGFFGLATTPGDPVAPGVTCRTLAAGEQMTFCVFEIAPGAEVPAHSHPEEQTALVLSGTLDAQVDGEARSLGKWEGYYAPALVEHGPNRNNGTEPVLCVDIFSPARGGRAPFASE
jgi:quercetin dioxygenase-like cupin family protein